MFAPKPRLKVRPPAVAGSFYPRGRGELKATVEALLSKAEPPGQRPLLGLIAPHAGYIYSGPVAASAFVEVTAGRHSSTRVLLIGPPHYVPVRGIAAPSAKAFATPLGEVAIDADAISRMVDAGLVSIDDRAHAPEHSLEVELPFLQIVLGDFTLIPLLVGDASPQQVASIVGALMDGRTLLVVSTDLSHYLDDASARSRDLATAVAIERLDYNTLGPSDACGFAALNGALCAGHEHGWTIRRLDLRNSGETSGDRSRVVGYGAWAFSATKSASA
jgi:AmmeMemoRadiSam system protein B